MDASYLAVYLTGFLAVWFGVLDTPFSLYRIFLPICLIGIHIVLCSVGSHGSSLEGEDNHASMSHGPALRLRGGHSSDDKGKAKATDSDCDSEKGIRVTAKSKKHRTGGMFVDKIIHIESVPEFWAVPASSNRVAYVLDLSNTPELLQAGRKPLTVDAFIKKEVRPARNPDCLRWDDSDETHLLISAPIIAAKDSEAGSVAAMASAFYRSVLETAWATILILIVKMRLYKWRSGELQDSRPFESGERGKMNGKTYFIGCSNWADSDSDHMSKTHRFTKIPSAVRESILVKLFKGEPIDEEDNDTEVLAESCMQIVHPSHLPKNSMYCSVSTKGSGDG
ncbi:hypothetical protein B0H10DRAFT_1937548 [Mycena sp. CBHHK59/15]|nr:hypothetical protein B0H10DRAFT_1937548 [Mycena sp. CBHHK59/15]